MTGEPDATAIDVGAAVSHGIDVVSIPRIANFLEEFGNSFQDRVFTPAEQAYCDSQSSPAQHYAGRWAAKEAFLKTLIDPAPGIPTIAIEVDRRNDGPLLSLAPAASRALADTLDELGTSLEAADIDVSLSHDCTAGYAVGSVTVVSTASRHD